MDLFELAKIHHEFSTAVMTARDMLTPILEGEIERGHCSPGTRECYGGRPGKRKTLLKDAKDITRHVVVILNKALNKFHDDTEKM